MDVDLSGIKVLKISKARSDEFIRVFRVDYTRFEKLLSWECAAVHDSVAALLYHRQKDAFVLVKQIRIPLFVRQEFGDKFDEILAENLNASSLKTSQNGYTYELCAGIMDKSLSEEKTIKEEILEELGYRVLEVIKIASFYNSLGTSANKQSIFYAEVDESMKVANGGGVDDEAIEPFFLKVAKAREFLSDESFVKPASLAYAMTWWLDKNRS